VSQSRMIPSRPAVARVFVENASRQESPAFLGWAVAIGFSAGSNRRIASSEPIVAKQPPTRAKAYRYVSGGVPRLEAPACFAMMVGCRCNNKGSKLEMCWQDVTGWRETALDLALHDCHRSSTTVLYRYHWIAQCSPGRSAGHRVCKCVGIMKPRHEVSPEECVV